MRDMKARIFSYIDKITSVIRDVNQQIHSHPEIALAEKNSSATLIEVLRAFDFNVQCPVAGMDTAFVATRSLGKIHPHVAYLAQYDALPELGHACGHNLVASASLASALATANFLPEIGGMVSVIGTPSEEVPRTSGKIRMLESGIFKDVDIAIMSHPHTRTWLSETFLSINEITVSFKGKAAHAGDTPYQGINAFDAIQLTLAGLNCLRQQVRQDARIHWGNIHVGGAVNIIPDLASATICLRASDNEYTDLLTEKAINCIRGAALMTGCEFDHSSFKGYRAFKVNEALVNVFRENLLLLGIQLDRPPTYGRAGSTDMGNVSQAVPAIYPLYKITENAPVHSKEFAQAAGTDRAFEIMMSMSKAMAVTGIQCLMDEDLMRRVRAAFK